MVERIKTGDVVVLRDDGCEYDVVSYNSTGDRLFLKNRNPFFNKKIVVVHEHEFTTRLITREKK